MALNFNGSSDKVSIATAVANPDTSVITMHTVFRPDSTTPAQNFIAIDRESGGNGPILCIYLPGSTAAPQAFWRPNNLSSVSVNGAATISTTAFNSCQAIFEKGVGLSLYRDGVADGSTGTTPSDSHSNLGGTRMGFLQNGGAGSQFFDGDYGIGAIWSDTTGLTAGELLALGKGAHPLLVRPQALVACVELIGGRMIDWLGTGFTLTGGSAVSTHPRIYRPSRINIGIPGEAVSGATGTGAFTLPSLTFSAAGTFPYRGSGAFTLPSLTTTAAGTLTFTGTSGFTLPSLTTAATATLTFTGTSGFTLPSLTTDASGSFTEAGAFTGTGAFTLPAMTTAALGTVTFVADSAFLLPSLNFSASGGDPNFVSITRSAPPAGGGTDNRKGERRKRRPYILPDGRRIWLYPEEIADLVARGNLPVSSRSSSYLEARLETEVDPKLEPAPLALPPVRDRSADIARLVNEAREAGRLADMVAGLAQGLAAAAAAERAAVIAEDQRWRRRRRAAALLLLQ